MVAYFFKRLPFLLLFLLCFSIALACSGSSSGGEGDMAPTTSIVDNNSSTTTTETITTTIEGEHPPEALGQSVSTDEDVPLEIVLTGTDADDDYLTFRVINAPINGTLDRMGGSIQTYTPNLDYSGTDSFTFITMDEFYESPEATIEITVLSIVDPPKVEVETPEGILSGDVEINFSVFYDYGIPVGSVTVEYCGGSVDSIWTAATISGDMENLVLDSTYTLFWHSVTDEPEAEANDYQIRITPNNAANNGIAGVTDTFIVANQEIVQNEIIWYVDINAPAGGNGLFWETAFQHPQDALDAATSDVDWIWVAQGDYTRRNSYDKVVLEIDSDVEIYGGFSGTETHLLEQDPAQYPTVLDGENAAYHVVYVIYGSRLDGFTIKGGKANGDSDFDKAGGGMLLDLCRIEIANCIIKDNSAMWGGGIVAYGISYSGSPVFSDCTITGNQAVYGGGIYEIYSSPVFLDCLVSENTAEEFGGGMYNLFIDYFYYSPGLADCIFQDNSAKHGGGMFNDGGASPTMYDSKFINNTVSGSGAGMFNYMNQPDLFGCDFIGNATSAGTESLGGGMYNESGSIPYLEDCTFEDNYSPGGGAIRNQGEASPIIVDSVFNRNRADYGGGAISNQLSSSPTIIGSIFNENEAGGGGAIGNFSSSPTITDCLFTSNIGMDGGAITTYDGSPTITNSVFSNNFAQGNSAYNMGGGLSNWANSYLTIDNCTFSANSAQKEGGAIANYENSIIKITNTVVWGNEAPSGAEIFGGTNTSITTIYSLVYGGYEGEGNIDADPLFINPGIWDDNETPEDDTDDIWTFDYTLQSGSPAIDAALGDSFTPEFAAPELDFFGNPRYDDPATGNTGFGTPDYIDIGAYEYQGE